MADANNDHVVKIVADTSEANKQLDESAAKLDNIDKKTDKASRSFAKLGSSLSASLKNSGINNIGDTLSGAFTKVKDMGASLRDSLRMSGEAKKSAQQIDDMGRSMEASVKRASAFQRILATLSPTARGFYDEAEEIRAKMVDLQAEMQAMAQQQLPTAEYAKVQEELRKTQAELDKYAAKRDKLVATSKNVEDTAAWQKLQGEITKTEERLVACVHQMRDMEASGEQYDDVFKATVAQLDKAQTRLDGLLSAQDQMRSRGVDQASQEWQKLAVEISTVQTNVQAYEAQIQNAKESGLDLSAAYKVLKDDMEAAEKQLEEYNSKQAQMKESGAVEHTAAWRNLQYDIDRATQQAESYKSVLASMEDTGAAFTSGADSDAYAEASQQLEEYKAELDDVSARGRSAFGGIASTIGSKLTGALKTAASIAGSTLVSALKKAGSGIASFVKGFANIGRQTKSTTSLIEKAARVFTSFGRMLKTRIKRTFISAVFKDIKASVGDIAKISDRFNTSVSGMVASCMQLGSQIIAAVEPIVTVAAPYISKFVDLLTAGADKLAQFIARLTGNNTYLKASKEQYDYAASLDETANSTNKAEKAAKSYQNTVLSFDQLNKMNGNDVDSEVEDITGVSDSTLNKAETQATALNEIADKIHDALTRGDYYGAGTAAAEGVNALVSSLRNMLGWSKNSDKITQKLGNFIDAVKGFTKGFNASVAGSAVGDVINTAIESLKILTDPNSGLPFTEMGAKFGEMVISGVKTIKWKDLGITIIEGLQSAVRAINGFLSTKFKDEETGKIETLGQTLGHALSDVFAGAIESIKPEDWAQLISGFINNFSGFLAATFSDPEKFGELGAKLSETINKTFAGIDADEAAKGLTNVSRAFNKFIENLVGGLDWSTIGGKLKDVFTSDEMDLGSVFKSLGYLMAVPLVKGLVSGLTNAGNSKSSKGGLLSGLGNLFGIGAGRAVSGLGRAAGGASGAAAGAGGAAAGGAASVGSYILAGLKSFGAITGTIAGIAGAVELILGVLPGAIRDAGITTANRMGANQIRQVFGDPEALTQEEIDALEAYGKANGEEGQKAVIAYLAGEGKSAIYRWLPYGVGMDVSAADALHEELWNLKESLEQSKEETVKSYSDPGTAVSDSQTAVGDALSTASESMTEQTANLSDLASTMSDVSAAQSAAFEEVVGAIDAVQQADSDFLSRIADYFNERVSMISDAVAKLASGNISTDTHSHTSFSGSRFAGRFANGGIVGDGQLFIANEGGRAELIGSDRGNTAVVNNNQIISAVVSGVRSAMMEAMMTFNNNTGGGDGAGDLVLIVDSEELARASLRGQRKIDKRTNPTMSFA